MCLIVSEWGRKRHTGYSVNCLRCARRSYLSCIPELVWAWMRIHAIRQSMTQNQQNTHTHRERQHTSISLKQKTKIQTIRLYVKLFFSSSKFYWAIKIHIVYKYTHFICSDDGDDRIKRPNTSKIKFNGRKTIGSRLKFDYMPCQWIILMGP